MRKKMVFKAIVFLVIAFFIISAYASYLMQAIPLLKASTAAFVQEKSKVTLLANPWDEKTSREYLRRDLQKFGIEPFQLTLKNLSSRTYIFSPQEISINHIPPKEVAEKIKLKFIYTPKIYWVFWRDFATFLANPINVRHKSNLNMEFGDFALDDPKELVLSPNQTLNGLIYLPLEKAKTPFTITLVDKESGEKLIFEVESGLK